MNEVLKNEDRGWKMEDSPESSLPSSIFDPLSSLPAELDAAQVAELAQCEAVITRMEQGYVEKGTAFFTILKGRLYRATHATFDEYCAEKFDRSTRHVYRTIGCALLHHKFLEQGLPVPMNERQARSLLELPEIFRLPAWVKTLEAAKALGKNPTAALIVECGKVLRGIGPGAPSEDRGSKMEDGKNGSALSSSLQMPVVIDAGTRDERRLAALKSTRAEMRNLLEVLGTADSAETGALESGLQTIDRLIDKLEARMERTQP